MTLGKLELQIAQNNYQEGADKKKLSVEDQSKLKLLIQAKDRKHRFEPIFYDTLIMVAQMFKQQSFKTTEIVFDSKVYDKPVEEAAQIFSIFEKHKELLSNEHSLNCIVT